MVDAIHRSAIIQLGRERLEAGESLRLKVISSSMWPFLRPGDWVVVAPLAETAVDCGDLLVAESGQEWITHRLVDRRGDRWITKGDNLWGFDAPFAREHFLGRVIAVQRGVSSLEKALSTPRRRAAARWLAWLSQWEGRLMHIAPHRPRRYVARLLALPLRVCARLLASMFWLL